MSIDVPAGSAGPLRSDATEKSAKAPTGLEQLAARIEMQHQNIQQEVTQKLQEQGMLGKVWDAAKNNLGSSGTNGYTIFKPLSMVVDSDLGSNAVQANLKREEQQIAELKKAAKEGDLATFGRAYKDLTGTAFDPKANHSDLASKDAVEKYAASQHNGVEFLADTGAMVGATMLTRGLMPAATLRTLMAADATLTGFGKFGLKGLTGDGAEFTRDFLSGAGAGLLAAPGEMLGGAVSGEVASILGLKLSGQGLLQSRISSAGLGWTGEGVGTWLLSSAAKHGTAGAVFGAGTPWVQESVDTLTNKDHKFDLSGTATRSLLGMPMGFLGGTGFGLLSREHAGRIGSDAERGLESSARGTVREFKVTSGADVLDGLLKGDSSQAMLGVREYLGKGWFGGEKFGPDQKLFVQHLGEGQRLNRQLAMQADKVVVCTDGSAKIPSDLAGKNLFAGHEGAAYANAGKGSGRAAFNLGEAPLTELPGSGEAVLRNRRLGSRGHGEDPKFGRRDGLNRESGNMTLKDFFVDTPSRTVTLSNGKKVLLNVRYAVDRTEIDFPDGQTRVIRHEPRRDYLAVLRDRERQAQTFEGLLQSGKSGGVVTGEAQANVPIDKLVGFTSDGTSKGVMPLKVLRGQTIASIMAGQPFGDVGPFGLALYQEAFAQLAAERAFQSGHGRGMNPLQFVMDNNRYDLLERMFAKKIAEILPEFRKNWRWELSSVDNKFIGATTGDSAVVPQPRTAILDPANAKNVLDEPMHIDEWQAQKQRLTATERTGESRGNGRDYLGRFTDFKDIPRSIPDLTDVSIEGIAIQPGALDRARILTEPDLTRIGHHATHYRGEFGLGGPTITAPTVEFYIRVFRALGVTSQHLNDLNAQQLKKLVSDYVARHAGIVKVLE